MEPIQIGRWHFHPLGRELTGADGAVKLTELEAAALRYLAERAGQTVLTDALLRDVWQYSERVQSRAVTHTMARLRKKMGEDGARIVTVHGKGFRLDIPDVGSLIGRGPLLADIVEQLERYRYLTLHGMAGVGKTRLARAVADRWAEVHWVSAGPLRTTDDLFVQVANTLGLPPATHTARSLGHSLQQAGPALMVVDTAEHLDAAAAEVFEAWVGHAPQLRILVTSRVLLAQERRVLVPPLDAEAAVRLFLRRADVLVPASELSEAAVIDIVGTVNGLPLAVELAAARLRVLELDELRQEMASDIRVLGGGEQGLVGVLEASWQALDPELQRLLSTAALFPDTFTTKMLGAVSGVDAVDLLDGLDALARAALIVERPPSFRLLDVVRTFAAAHVADASRGAFVKWANELAAAALEMIYVQPATAIPHLVDEAQLYYAALGHTSDVTTTATLALAMQMHGTLFGAPQRARPFLDALDVPSLPGPLQIDVHLALWTIHANAYRRQQSAPLARQALAVARQLDDPVRTVRSWVRVINDTILLQGVAAAQQESASLVAITQSYELPPLVRGLALDCMSEIAWRLEDYEGALHQTQESLELRSSKPDSRAATLGSLVRLHLLMGRPDTALPIARRAYLEARESNVTMAIVRAGGGYAAAALELEKPDLARRIYDVVIPLARDLQNVLAVEQFEIGMARTQQSDEEALSMLFQICERATTSGRRLIAGWASLYAGERLHMAGDFESAIEAYRKSTEALTPTEWKLPKTLATCWGAIALMGLGERKKAHRWLQRGSAKAGLAHAILLLTSAAFGATRETSIMDEMTGTTLSRTREFVQRLQTA